MTVHKQKEKTVFDDVLFHFLLMDKWQKHTQCEPDHKI